MKEQVKELWKLCFPDDSDDFVDLYFSSRYSDDINSVITDNGKVVSALQRIPYPMTFGRDVIPVAYISGACTRPEYRSKGLMRRLLAESHRRMYEDGKYLSVLIPANEGLVAYYAASGYEVCFKNGNTLLTDRAGTVHNLSDGLVFEELSNDGKSVDDVSDFIYERLSMHPASILHTAEDMRIVLADLYMSGGKVWCGYDKSGNMCAVAFIVLSGSRMVVKELVSADEQSGDAILAFLMKHYALSEVEKPSPCGMVRVINAYGMLKCLATSIDGECLVEVYGDETLPANNGCYLISHGTCQRVEGNVCSVDASYIKIDIKGLASWLFANTRPYMSLMLD